MATGLSLAVVTGNITRDAELKSDRLLAFSVAVNRYEKSADGTSGEQVHFFDCKVLGNRAMPLAGILSKGTKVTVHGDLVQERWESQDGGNRSAVRILAREVIPHGSPNGAPAESKSDDDPGW